MLTDNVIVERLRQSNTEFRELEESHHRLDLELNELQKRHVLTPAEELTKKQMQKDTQRAVQMPVGLAWKTLKNLEV